jgi:hypothetical protein
MLVFYLSDQNHNLGDNIKARNPKIIEIGDAIKNYIKMTEMLKFKEDR